MDKKEEIESLISKIKKQAWELIETIDLENMSAEQVVVLSTEIVTALPVSQMHYTQPIGIVDRRRVSFVVDEELEYDIPLSGEIYDE